MTIPPGPNRPAQRIHRLQLPERAPSTSDSARQADRDLLAAAPAGFLDTTHFDTIRFPPPSWAHDVFAHAADDGALAYTGYRGHPEVLASVAEVTSDFLGIPVDPERHVLLTPGTQAGLFATMASLVDDGDTVVLVDPDYLFSERILRFLNAQVAHIRLSTTPAGATLDLDALETLLATRHPRLLVLSHPNNPTGAVYPQKVLQRIAELAHHHDLTIVVDELYARLIYDDTPFTHLAALPGMRDRVVTLLGPSKTESLSGYRVGVVIAPAPISEAIEDVLSITALRAPAYAQHLLRHWLRDDHDWLANRLTDLQQLQQLTASHFQRLPWLSWHPQPATAYAWPDISALGQPDPAIAHALLREAAVLISPGYQFGPHASGHFRVCYARDEQQWDRALDRVITVLDHLAHKHGLPPSTDT